ncbi:hypothetical protein E2C01_054521 [Portunus trituberculatus]|uniref:Uncharacterized protein n=1 Tax=Portunus trituberculatus TaxID=210409 RepID=A0A5B7GS76_PORTR|nr:hypothetical protein [Portunus trituberculatus]
MTDTLREETEKTSGGFLRRGGSSGRIRHPQVYSGKDLVRWVRERCPFIVRDFYAPHHSGLSLLHLYRFSMTRALPEVSIFCMIYLSFLIHNYFFDFL